MTVIHMVVIVLGVLVGRKTIMVNWRQCCRKRQRRRIEVNSEMENWSRGNWRRWNQSERRRGTLVHKIEVIKLENIICWCTAMMIITADIGAPWSIVLVVEWRNGWRHNYVQLPVLDMWAHVYTSWCILYAPPQIIFDKSSIVPRPRRGRLITR